VNAQPVTLYRGLAIPKGDARRTEGRIRSGGMSGTEGQWQFPVPDIQARRIAMCNLAGFDPAVALSHLQNQRVIGGRYRTKFASAFFVKAPVSSNQISRVYAPVNQGGPSVYISLDNFINGVDANPIFVARMRRCHRVANRDSPPALG